jgi:TPR repeat protein
MTGGGGRKTHVSLAEVLALAVVVLTPEDESLVLAADGGDPEAQCDLAMWLLEAGRAAVAREWFTYAARAGYPDAMCWLGRNLLLGHGGPRDEAGGMMWLSQAAARNSTIGKALMTALYGAAGQQARAAADLPTLERILDAVERDVLLSALHETADPKPA